MSTQIGTRLDALDALLSERAPERRRELLREAADVFFAPEPVPEGVAELFDRALECMAESLEAELRIELAKRFSAKPGAPRRLVSRLIGDDNAEVARPLLESSPVLTERELLRVAASQGQGHLRAIAVRPDLTTPITGVIVERGDDDTVGVLLANEKAPLSREASEAVTDRALANPALHALLVARENFPIDLLNEMYLAVATQLRDRIAARNAKLEPEQLERALALARNRLATRDGALPSDYVGASEQVEMMRRKGELGPSQLVAFARFGEKTKFMVALSLQADVDFGAVRRCLDRGDGEAFALLCKAAGYENDLFRTLLMVLRPTGDTPWQPVMNRYMSLPREVAQRIVRFWKVRHTAALAA